MHAHCVCCHNLLVCRRTCVSTHYVKLLSFGMGSGFLSDITGPRCWWWWPSLYIYCFLFRNIGCLSTIVSPWSHLQSYNMFFHYVDLISLFWVFQRFSFLIVGHFRNLLWKLLHVLSTGYRKCVILPNALYLIVSKLGINKVIIMNHSSHEMSAFNLWIHS